MTKKEKNKYFRPSIKSSKIKIISFYGRSTLRTAADGELLLASIPT